MILEFIEALDIGYLGKQRLVFKVLDDGNLIGHQLFLINHFLYSFPSYNVKRGAFVIFYITNGENCTKEICKTMCHFFYYGERLRLWEEQAATFRLVFQTYQ